VILEGPYAWPVRPVAELFTDHTHDSPRVTSRLIGAIWRAREDLAFDIGFRFAHAGDESIREFRVGLTWAFEWKKER
jgi:hypothetical protein